MRRLLLLALGWLVLAAGVASVTMWVLSVAALCANALGASLVVTLGGIARGTLAFTAGIVLVMIISRHTSLLTWRCQLRT